MTDTPLQPHIARFRPLADILFLCASSVALRLFLSLAMKSRSSAAGPPWVFWGYILAALISALLVLRAFLRLKKSRDDWPFYLGASFLFILLYKIGKYRPEIAAIELPLAVFSLVPAAILLAAFARKVRQADELERRILGRALAIAFAAAFAAMILYGFAEGLGLPLASAVWWSALLLGSWSLGLAIAAHRYRE